MKFDQSCTIEIPSQSALSEQHEKADGPAQKTDLDAILSLNAAYREIFFSYSQNTILAHKYFKMLDKVKCLIASNLKS